MKILRRLKNYQLKIENHLRERDDRSGMIATARQELEGLDKYEKDDFNDYLAKSSSSAWLDARLGLDKKKLGRRRKNYVGKLTARDKKSGEYTVDDDLMINFLEWHNHDLIWC